ncbi:MAG: ATP-binding protein [Methanobacteriaceae archaeon]|jgi:DNA helicase HerA-like ATPase|uniref:helicase HerA domain-containing protein n=1 Tax=Methanobrevibacter TaxID=2172 RepID=UPI0037606837|nr:ATP-binding protein [Methanobacteriaceae archaeon]MDD4594902.1 ATP-binding protein [Methanobacteriaceae archaeon]
MIIGRSIGETTLVNLSFISKKMPSVGEYVTLNYDGKTVLGMIESMVRGSVSLNNEIYDPDTIDKIKEIEGNDYYIKGNVRILGDVNDNLKLPRTPAPPGTEVEKASTDILKDVFDQENSLTLGHLISQEEVEVGVDLNKMVSRHLAILAMTGAGKSNTVSVLVDELLKNNGCIFIFDMHSEYINAKFKNGEVNPIKPIINPKYMEFDEIKKLANIGSNAVNQERYIRKAFKEAKEQLQNGEAKTPDFLEQLLIILNKWELDDDRPSKERNNIIDVINKIEDLQSTYGKLLDTNTGNILTQLKPNSCNVLDLGQVDENTAEVIVSHVLRNALKSRKNFIHENDVNALNIPVFFVLEEAHILAPQNRSTKCKYWITRIAREGRKFGLGLCMVSQSPKSVDSETLSQANNMIILRLVEPKDQQHVQSSSESLSDDLVGQLPSLNVGEALVLGMMTKIPTLVKINSFKGKNVGGDLDICKIWSQNLKSKTEELDEMEDDFLNLGGDY